MCVKQQGLNMQGKRVLMTLVVDSSFAKRRRSRLRRSIGLLDRGAFDNVRLKGAL